MPALLQGASAPFSLVGGNQSNAQPIEGLLSSAIAALSAGDIGTAFIAAETVCRQLPRESVPAILRAKILEDQSRAWSAKAWYLAWRRDPLDPTLQDALLSAWLHSGATDAVISLGTAFLAHRCKAGNHASLVNLLMRAQPRTFGACWRANDSFALMVFCPANTPPEQQNCGLTIASEEAQVTCNVAANGRIHHLAAPIAGGVWSIAFSQATTRAGSPNQLLLSGSPLVFPGDQVPSPGPARPEVPAKRPGKKRPFARQSQPSTATLVHIIVPVFRNFALVQACLQSVIDSLPHNATPTQLTVVNDASPEAGLVHWLEALQRTYKITLITNGHNLGFIETCNRAMRQCKHGHVLLLNADTLVHGDWVDRMAASLHQASDIASVTPWSNNGEVTSFPTIGNASNAPNLAQIASINAVATRVRARGESADVEIPTACGFAMLMRRQAIDTIGLLDGVGLLRGYSEEVDWCLRATAAGYRHLAATAVFVAHAGKASFGYEKHLRVAQNRAVIAARYPNFYDQYHHFLRADPLSKARQALCQALIQEGLDWPFGSNGKSAYSRARSVTLPSPLPTGTLRIAVWHPPVGSMAATKVLALARYLATNPPVGVAVRILVLGAVTESCLRTGVVDVIPPQAEPTETDIASDMALLGLCGCKVVLCAKPLEVSPQGIDVVPLQHAFEPRAWLDAWLLSVQPDPTERARPQTRAKRRLPRVPASENCTA